MIRKLDQYSPAFYLTGTSDLRLKAGTEIAMPPTLPSRLIYFAADTEVELPALVAGTDYAIYITYDRRVIASTNFSAPVGYDPTTVQLIGGFHFAPGGPAAAQAGGNTTPQVNPYAIWDRKFRPANRDARGMALIAGAFWADIYLLGTNPDVNGTSSYGATIADGSSPPKVPALFGGNGTTDYGSLTWFQACELAAAYGKRLPDYADFAALAYGVTQETSVGADPVTCGLDAPRTSEWGIMQAAGDMLIWGNHFVKSSTAGAWEDQVGGRGQLYGGDERAAVFGGNWYYGSVAGSRCSNWDYAPWASNGNIGARFRSDHLSLP
jgi:hypothetical protein